MSLNRLCLLALRERQARRPLLRWQEARATRSGAESEIGAGRTMRAVAEGDGKNRICD
jgi:hypothetical protein